MRAAKGGRSPRRSWGGVRVAADGAAAVQEAAGTLAGMIVPSGRLGHTTHLGEEGMVNRKRGLVRLGIVLALGWCLFWGLAAYFSDQTISLYLREIDKIEAQTRQAGQPLDRAYLDRTMPLWDRVNEGNDWVQASVQWGIGIPLILLFVVPIGWWIYRGFKPKPLPQDNEPDAA